ncbi:FHA domain-containing protein FhaB/FipA [Brachybacterium phenoliresistens]|uniref:Signal peptide protein n=1 Tax=Brachybacterium phenoliresistens TaxID=396014 RepID=Z9JQC8_9MICO|nr:FHA domain-containing protein [Brachybacterium phenoliresistens]EWS79957.1 signal peptide protein [Brachybacterium phenoliresistens]
MSELTIYALRIGFTIALWLFVVAVLLILRGDLFGTTVLSRGSKPDPRREQRPTADPSQAASLRTEPAPTTTVLVVTAGNLRGTTLTLGATPVLIGRAPECTLVLDDDYASNRHARVYQRDDEWFVEDLGSTNGTLLSGRKIEGSAPFKPGAQVRIGRTVIELRRGPR